MVGSGSHTDEFPRKSGRYVFQKMVQKWLSSYGTEVFFTGLSGGFHCGSGEVGAPLLSTNRLVALGSEYANRFAIFFMLLVDGDLLPGRS